MNKDIKLFNIKVDEPDFIPTYARVGDAGADIRANLNITPQHIFGMSEYIKGKGLVIKPNSRVLVDCGFSIELEIPYQMEVRPRSGKATKGGMHIPNSPGTVDSGYRGKVMVGVHNMHPTEDLVITHKERIAQIIISTYEQCQFVIVDELQDTERGATGFGDSGKQ